jgi:predicted NBD/HSP70 family sugar kinase
MYLAIDIGGSKTLLAVFNEKGHLLEQLKVPTNKDYSVFLDEIEEIIVNKLAQHRFAAICCAAPGEIDQKNGKVIRFGNLAWKNTPLKHDLEKILPHTPILLQNDAKLAGLSEAIAHPKYQKVLYLTISTGIGDGIIIDQKIDLDFDDSEPGQMMIEFEGKIYKWEDLSSGRALFKKYGKKASEIDDPTIWRHFAKGLARGMNELIATIQPDAIILGGGVGAHYEKFSKYLLEQLDKLENDMVQTPPIIKAQRAEEAVTYGCYEYIKQSI